MSPIFCCRRDGVPTFYDAYCPRTSFGRAGERRWGCIGDRSAAVGCRGIVLAGKLLTLKPHKGTRHSATSHTKRANSVKTAPASEEFGAFCGPY